MGKGYGSPSAYQGSVPLIRIARHGETTWNREGRYQGRLDAPLSETGMLQAQALASALARYPLKRIISSPLSRCMETARPLADRMHLPVERDERLIEIAHGAWENKLRDEIVRDDPQRFWAWKNDPANVSFPGGESLVDVRNRWRGFCSTFSPNGDTVIVTHDVIARIAILEATGQGLDALWKPRVINAAYAEYLVENGVWKLIHECCDSHLGNLAVDISHQAL